MTAQRLSYRRLFDITKPGKRFDSRRAYRFGDEPGGEYVYDEDEEDRPGRIELGVNVALASGRPLLVRGLPGTGKSALAADVAQRLGWRYYEAVVSSRTQARDLQYTFDAIKRLSDAQVAGVAVQRDGDDAPARGVADDAAYIEPGVLWWAFDRDQARRRGLSAAELARASIEPAADPADVAGTDEARPRPERTRRRAHRRDRQGRSRRPERPARTARLVLVQGRRHAREGQAAPARGHHDQRGA